MVWPALRAACPITGMVNTMSAASSRRSRCAGCLSCTATDAISPSNGNTPAWLATINAAPVSGRFSIPLTSTRNHELKKTLSKGKNTELLRC